MARNISPAPGSIRSVQRGVTTGVPGTGQASITISAINTARAVVTVNGGNYGDDDGGAATGACPTVQSLSSTNLTVGNAAYKSASTDYGVAISWQIVEYY